MVAISHSKGFVLCHQYGKASTVDKMIRLIQHWKALIQLVEEF